MSRHRNVRSMNYQDEYDGYDDVYGHSVEDDFCCSPGTVAQFTYKRDGNVSFSSMIPGDADIPEEQEVSSDDEFAGASLKDSGSLDAQKRQLDDIQRVQLNTCLEEMHNILGETVPEHLMVDAALKHKFNYELALSYVLNQQSLSNSSLDSNQLSRGKQRKAGGMVDPPDDPHMQRIGATGGGWAGGGGATGAVSSPAVAPLPTTTRMTFSNSTPQTGFVVPDPPPTVSISRGSNSDSSNNTPKVTPGTTPKVTPTTTPKVTPSSTPNVHRKENLEASSSGRSSPDDSSNSRLSTPKRTASDRTSSPVNKSKMKQNKENILKELAMRKETGRDMINMVVIGHVDAGKSTLMGHVLFNLGFVQRKTMQKYEHESRKLGKSSFAYAWVLDETEEERSRGVTMDVAQTTFETNTKLVTLLDAPGHKDFIPNMITGAAQADCAVLVVNATRGEFETGFDQGGQTREHAMLIRSLGVGQLVVAVNKMDTVEWDEDRFNEIVTKLQSFLKQAGFKENDVHYVPCSGLSGVNLTEKATIPELAWYQGSTLVDRIDKFKPPNREFDKPVRISISDVLRGVTGGGLYVSGSIKAGIVQPSSRILVQPQGESGSIKSITIDDVSANCAFAGDNVTMQLTGVDTNNIGVGSIICEPSDPIRVTARIQARIVIFNIDVPITKSFPVVFHYLSLSEPAHIRKLISQLNRSTGEVVRHKPRCITKNSSAIIELEINRPICIELYKDYKDLGRFMLRYSGSTIAAGLVTDIVKPKIL